MQVNNGTTNLASGLRQLETGARTPFCPEDHLLAAWYEKRLDAAGEVRLEQHLSTCGYCRSRIGMLGRLEQEYFESPVSEDLLARSKQLAGGIPVKRRTIAPVWGAAAVIVLSLGLLLKSDWYRSPPAPEQPKGRQLRSIQPAASRPEILQPSPNAIVTSGGLTVQWTPVDGSMFYELLVMDGAGRLLLKQRSQDTVWRPTGALDLKPGGQYYVRVNAYLPDGSVEGSQHSKFSVVISNRKPDSGQE